MKNALRLLIIDDDKDDRTLFVEAVNEVDSSIDCMTAKDGKQVLELLKENPDLSPDFIFLDLRMPRYDGKKFLHEMMHDENLKRIPVIIYTTSMELAESRELKEMGAVHFISKPSNPAEIYYLISFVLEEKFHSTQRNP